jgi:chromosome segregation ATPase
MNTDTPRTDAAWNTCGDDCEPYLFARQLERELTEAKALCARQYKAIQKLEQETTPQYWKEKCLSYCERAERAEAEVERLDHLLADASETNHKLGAEVLVLKKELAALQSEKNACLDGNVYYGNKIGILNDRINRVLGIL